MESWGARNRRVAWCGKPTQLVVECCVKAAPWEYTRISPGPQNHCLLDAWGGIFPELSRVGSRSPNRIPVAPAQLVWGALDVRVQVLTQAGWAEGWAGLRLGPGLLLPADLAACLRGGGLTVPLSPAMEQGEASLVAQPPDQTALDALSRCRWALA